LDWLNGVSGFAFPFLERVPVIRAVVGFVLVFFLPGFVWSLCFFRNLKALERITLSIALSIALVTLSLLFVNRLTGLRINGLNSVLIILVVTILPVIAYYLNRVIRNRGLFQRREE